MTCSETW